MRNDKVPSLAKMVAVLLFVTMTTPSWAAHRCTKTELNQYSALLNTATATGNTCGNVLKKKPSLTNFKKACSACAPDYRAAQRMDAWIGKHPKCAADLHISQLHRAGHGWIKTYKDLCL